MVFVIRELHSLYQTAICTGQYIFFYHHQVKLAHETHLPHSLCNIDFDWTSQRDLGQINNDYNKAKLNDVTMCINKLPSYNL